MSGTIDPLTLDREDYIAARLATAFPPERSPFVGGLGGTGARYRPRTDIDPFLDRVARERERAGRAWDAARRARRRATTPPRRPPRQRPAPATPAPEATLASYLAAEESHLAGLEARLRREPGDAALREWAATCRFYVERLRRDVARDE